MSQRATTPSPDQVRELVTDLRDGGFDELADRIEAEMEARDE